jgi:acyl-coA synthetase family member 2
MELIKKSISSILEDTAKTYPNLIAIEDNNARYTWDRLNKLSTCLAYKFLEMGITNNSYVGLFILNSPDWIISFFALEKIGALAVLINTYFKGRELLDVVKHSDLDCIMYSNDIELKKALEPVKKEKMVKNIISISELINEDYSKKDFEINNEFNPFKPACMMFTSGTTSIPKGVLLSQFNLVNNARAIAEAMRWNENDKLCIAVPMFHCFGLTAGILACLISKTTMVIPESNRSSKIVKCIREHKCSILNGVPSMFLAIANKFPREEIASLNLKSGVIAGSFIGYEEFKYISDIFNDMKLQPSYGQTETSPCVTIANLDASIEEKAASAGRAIEHVDIRINGIEGALYCEKFVQGEIEVKGYNVMLGYYNNKFANENVFTDDGWLKTGDMGYIDDEKFLHISGRIKEMIIRCGENISPYEIENAIKELNEIKEVKVIGIESEIVQEEIVACIILKEKHSLTDIEIREFLKDRLAKYKIPAYIVRLEEFPYTTNEKIELLKLKKIAVEFIKQFKK